MEQLRRCCWQVVTQASRRTRTQRPNRLIVLEETTQAPTRADETVMALTPDGPLLPSVEGVEAEYTEPIPDYLRKGMQHPIVKQLQERLMDLGFMDNDEPTEFYGEVSQAAVKVYQRQNKLAQDGIVGPETLEAILSPDAKYYAAQHGDVGDDIMRIQTRLYELGYLATDNLVTGNFGDSTEEADKKMQGVNGLDQDGKVREKDHEPDLQRRSEAEYALLRGKERCGVGGAAAAEAAGLYDFRTGRRIWQRYDHGGKAVPVPKRPGRGRFPGIHPPGSL